MGDVGGQVKNEEAKSFKILSIVSYASEMSIQRHASHGFVDHFK